MEFKYLGKSGFPHGETVDTHKYDNQMDYSRFDASQMTVLICNVPWDQGEAHIGNRVVEGYGNVVHFGSEERRDIWFDNIPGKECERWETRYRDLHTTMTIDIPLPFDVAATYNYVVVRQHELAREGDAIAYESLKTRGIRSWHYFIRDMEMMAPSTTRIHLLHDVWQDFIYRLGITGMLLERGHAPMVNTTVDQYLQSPAETCDDLLADDISAGEPCQVRYMEGTPLNRDDMRAVIVTSADPSGAWGTKGQGNWCVPALPCTIVGGVPSTYMLTLPANDLMSFLLDARARVPQWFQSVQAIFLIESSFLALTDTFTFAGHSCARVVGGQTRHLDVIKLSAAQFGYDARYAKIAKLYTSPYAHLEVTDETGNVTVIKVEDTVGALSATVCANLVFPFLKLRSILVGAGGTKGVTVTFRNLTGHDMTYVGDWARTIMEWEIPTFQVVLQSSARYDYSTHFDRAQLEADRLMRRDMATRDATIALTNANALAGTSCDNAQEMANAVDGASHTTSEGTRRSSETMAFAQEGSSNERTNAQSTAEGLRAEASRLAERGNANTVINNAAAQTVANTAIATAGNTAATSDCNLSNALAQALQAWDAGYTRNTINANAEAATQTAAIGATSSVVQGAWSGGVSGFMSGGVLGAQVGAVGGLVSGGISAATTGLSTAVAINLDQRKAEASIQTSQSKTTSTAVNNTQRTSTANNGKTAIRQATNDLVSTSAANTASTMRDNADVIKNSVVESAKVVHDARIGAAETLRKASVSAAGIVEGAQNAAADTTRDAQLENATRLYDTEMGNSKRTYEARLTNANVTYDNDGSRIDNMVRQAALEAPQVYGSVTNAETALVAPQLIMVAVKTQSRHAIAHAGDIFLRFGYVLNKWWEFDGVWCLCSYFTYWKVTDFIVRDNGIQDVWQDMLRLLLMGGVTVWRDPNMIGKVSIYDNFN